MTTTTKTAHSPGAMRAAKLMAINPKVRQLAHGIILREEFSNELAEIIDRETAAPEMLEALDFAEIFIRSLLLGNPSPKAISEALDRLRTVMRKANGEWELNIAPEMVRRGYKGEAATQKARGGQ